MRFTKNIQNLILIMVLLGTLFVGFTESAAAKCTSGSSCIALSQANPEASQFFKLLSGAVTFLTAGVGIVVTAMIVIGGIQYSTANGDPQKVAGAKKTIYNALFALVAFIFLWAFMQWLIPGGVFS